MRYAAFFRNVNLGRPHCPTRVQLEDAFLRAGAAEAVSFLTNGTLVFAVTGGRRRAQRVLREAHGRLADTCGLQEPAFLRSVDELARHVSRQPFAGIAEGRVYACCVSFLGDGVTVPDAVPRVSARRDVELLQVAGADVFSLSRQVGKAPGSPNAYLERQLGSPASTRVWNTVVRLVARFGRAGTGP